MFFRAYHSSLIVNDCPRLPKPLAMPGNPGSAISIVRDLLGAVDDELAADHLDIGVLGPLVSLAWWPKVSVAQCMPMNPLPPRIAS